MPRAKANPDPMVVEHARSGGAVYVIHAHRNGTWTVFRDGKPARSGSDPLAGFEHHVWPSNRRQAEALENAKGWLDAHVGDP